MTMHLGLALSGGGFRATLFHIGVIRYLREVGRLRDVTHVASVSGGSITAAHLVLNWDRYNGTEDDFQGAVDELVRFVQLDVRNRIARRIPFQLPLRFLNRMFIGRPNRALTPNGLLERHYRDHLYGDRCFHQLPESPELHILATNLSDGNLASFSREGLYMERRGEEETVDFVPARLAPISMAVAASSAFPGFFPPVLFSASDVGVRAGEFSYLSFTDGGVYDNLGVRAFRWVRRLRQQRNSEFRASDLDDAKTVLEACRAAAVDPSTPLGWLKSRFSPDLRDRLELDGGASSADSRQMLCEEMGELVRRHRFAEEPVFDGLQLGDEEAAEWFAKSREEELDQARHEWLNRHLLAAALEQVVGRKCLKLVTADFDHILVSDCGQSFNVQGDANMGFLAQSVRASDIMWDRVWQLEKENFSKSGQYLFVPITDTIDKERDAHANPLVIQTAIQSIRTDLDRFSDLEIRSLVEHGYTVARATCRENGVAPADSSDDRPPWNPFGGSDGSRGSREGDAGDRITEEARSLRRSAGRRIWSTLFDFRDWPTYVFIPLLVLLLIVMPWRAWTFYQESQVLETVVKAIEQGDPDIKRILEIVTDDPLDGWEPDSVKTVAAADPGSHEGLVFLTRTRTEDRRHYRPGAHASKPAVYLQERITIRKREEYEGDNRVVLSYPLPANVELRAGPERLRPEIRRTDEGLQFLGSERFLYEFEFDISDVPLGSTAVLEVEGLVRHGQTTSTEFGQDRSIFRTTIPVEVVSVWLLFSPERPYENYNLLLRSADGSTPPKLVETRYTIDHPYGSMIGWSLVNPEVGGIYECRWVSPE